MFFKRDGRKRRRQLMVSDGKVHGSSEVGAAQHGIAIHTVCRQVDARTDRVREDADPAKVQPHFDSIGSVGSWKCVLPANSDPRSTLSQRLTSARRADAPSATNVSTTASIFVAEKTSLAKTYAFHSVAHSGQTADRLDLFGLQGPLRLIGVASKTKRPHARRARRGL